MPLVAEQTRPASSRKGKAKANSSKIGTLGGLQQSDDDDDDEKPAEFYTGGEKSGLGVIDPTSKKGKHASNDLVKEILKKAAAYVCINQS